MKLLSIALFAFLLAPGCATSVEGEGPDGLPSSKVDAGPDASDECGTGTGCIGIGLEASPNEARPEAQEDWEAEPWDL